MRSVQTTILTLLLALFTCSCNNTDINPDPDPDPDPLPNADITLDELADKEVYTEGMIVDCRYFMGEKTNRMVVNHSEYGSPETLDLTRAGYYRIEIFTKSSSSNTPDVIRMVILDPERGQAEWGLPPWTPEGVKIETIGNQEILTIYPRNIPQGFDFPLVVVVDGELTRSTDNLEAVVGSTSFLVKRGVGSIWVSSGDQSPDRLVIDHRSFPIQTGTMAGPPLSLSGVMEENTHIPSGSYVNIPEDLTIPSGIIMTIDSGAFITIDPEVNIYNEGTLLIEGSEASPVTITCTNHEAYWGGVIGTAAGNRVKASHTIFGRSGYHTGGGYDWGHAHRQALFYCANGSLSLDHCYMIDHIGQVCYTVSASLEMESCLVQRVKTGGQLNASQVSINHSVFTDFPDDSNVYQDNDNDGLYLIECVAVINNSAFMYAKDDGLDSGGGTVGGEVTVTNTRFESIFHEGAALSGGSSSGKNQNFYNCIFLDCGQGLELGYSSSKHLVTVDFCSFLRNGIGIRYGDNYEFPNNGYISVSNSESLENITFDIWNMDREDWIADTFHMEFSNVWVTTGNPMYPQLNILE